MGQKAGVFFCATVKKIAHCLEEAHKNCKEMYISEQTPIKSLFFINKMTVKKKILKKTTTVMWIKSKDILLIVKYS